jgi:hypothetical protein
LNEEQTMREAVVEHSGLFLGECGCCRGSFLYIVRRKSSEEPGRPANTEGKAFLVGRCPDSYRRPAAQ